MRHLEQVWYSLSSYRTYEEWKPSTTASSSGMYPCSYRTYEEWKQNVRISLKYVSVSSYRTYEEWKQL